MLHPNFKGDSLDANENEISFFEALELSETARLYTYTLEDNTKTVSSRRFVWVMYNDDWKLLFHQGTKIDKK